ncbi:MAG: hypothetical protein KatS3mg100_296 [Candidatus Parcubacteria bacterium]|nr:MAG: hypothetical protein KatS3mg100_296 [Candidatus Parcubacteria bacterium]
MKHQNSFPHSLTPAWRARGSMTLTGLVFGLLFIGIAASLAGFILTQADRERARGQYEAALRIAEAGIAYYRWRLAHFPNDLTDGTGAPPPYEHAYSDPETGVVGTFSLQISGQEFCGKLSSITITSTGWTAENPQLRRAVRVTLARPTVAEYSYLLNSNVWAGSDRQIYGPYHTNGGVRMDGTNHSTVTSAQETWWCTSSFGCSGSGEWKTGVFGSGPNSHLWQYPVASFDFNNITLDLASIRDAVQEGGGIYLAPQGKGFHIVLQPDGSARISRVQAVDWVWAYDTETGWHQSFEIIRMETFLETRTIPAECPIIYAEGDVWLEGVVAGKVSVIAARPQDPAKDPTIYLAGNITYAENSTADGLAAVAEGNVLIPLLSPDLMTLRGVFIAQRGWFGRKHYHPAYLSSAYDPYVFRDYLSVQGSVVSNGRVGTKWSCGGSYCSGYNERVNAYDRQLAIHPPPLVPTVREETALIEWREVTPP